MKERIAAGEVPLVGIGGPGPRGGHGFVHFGGLEAAADYLGLSDEELREELFAGSSLADVAEEQGVSVDGLVDAIVTAATEDLGDAVAAGRLTDAQRDEIVATLEARVTEMVNRTGPGHPDRGAGMVAAAGRAKRLGVAQGRAGMPRTALATTTSSRGGTTSTRNSPRWRRRAATASRTSGRFSPTPPEKASTSSPPRAAAIDAAARATR